jgi:hypothetical protein
MLSDEAARHESDQQRAKTARDRVGVAEITVGIGLQQEEVIGDVNGDRENQVLPRRALDHRHEWHDAEPHDRAGRHDQTECCQTVRLVGLQDRVPGGVHQRCGEQQRDDQGLDDQGGTFFLLLSPYARVQDCNKGGNKMRGMR